MTENTLLQRIEKTLNSKQMADVQFSIGNEQQIFYSHSYILSLISKEWKRQLYPEDWQNEPKKRTAKISLPDTDPKIFFEFLKWAYTNKITLTKENVLPLFVLSNEYEIPDLKSACFRWLESDQHFFSNPHCFNDLSTSNVIELLSSGVFLASEYSIFQRIYEFGVSLILKEDKESNQKIDQNRMSKNQKDQEKKKNKKKEKEKEKNWVKGNVILTNEGKITKLKNVLRDILALIKLELMSSTELEKIYKTGLIDHERVMNILVQRTKESFRIGMSRRNIKKTLKSELRILLIISEQQHPWISDLIQSIRSQGIQTVDCLDASKKTGRIPKLEEVCHYDAIVLYSNAPIASREKLGDLLADYVDTGGGLVVFSINSLMLNYSGSLSGRIVKDAYLPFQLCDHSLLKKNKKGTLLKFIDNHPISENVEKFNGGKSSFHLKVTNCQNGGTPLLWWKDKSILVAEKRRNTRGGITVVLNFFPISQNTFVDGWDIKSDGHKLISNSIAYVSFS
ncbi:btb (poz) domain-containing 2a-related [Anaeramoeba flamelloides]|uniref:Btb (Poz) domain-containing 2a-related n=1 Tax=Anaeramoeba flamelloides TaxID=1746091 RepID=A0ABQ8YMB7_9EUKA|nr:btb (poz) domain-containing 2a-related [Anaeramoeba flamelloides]